MKKKTIKKILEAAAVVSVAAVMFMLARKAGIAYRGNELWGGELCVPFLIIGGWYAVKGIIRDIRSGLFSAEVDDAE